MLFDADVRYTEILNAFDVMISDYSSIVFDYLLLDRPVIYLIPDYEEYRSQRGFVFRNIDSYMPGDKAFDFRQMLDALQRVFDGADGYQEARGFVLSQRFDYRDNQSSKRCLEAILNYQKEEEEMDGFHEDERTRMPSAAEHLMSFLPEGSCVVDSTKRYSDDEKNVFLHSEKKIFYISSEIPNPYRRLTGQSSAEIADIDFYEKIKHLETVRLFLCRAGWITHCSLRLPENQAAVYRQMGAVQKSGLVLPVRLTTGYIFPWCSASVRRSRIMMWCLRAIFTGAIRFGWTGLRTCIILRHPTRNCRR